MQYEVLLKRLKSLANPKNVEGMARFGINSKNTLGVSVNTLRGIGKEVKKEIKDRKLQHELSLQLWNSGIHEARILATIIDLPDMITDKQLEIWVKDLDSWDVTDSLALNLVDKTKFAFEKAKSWAESSDEFVRRAGFATMAGLAIHNKEANDKDFEEFFPLIKKYSTDERNFVKKSVNWALRQIGKRNDKLLPKTLKLAEDLEKSDSKSAKWIAKDALKELRKKII